MEQSAPQQNISAQRVPTGGALRVPSFKPPSFFNREMAVGFAAGLPILPILTAPLGAIIGSVVGRFRMKREFQEGKVVKPPSFFNSTMILGGGFGTIGGVVVAGVLSLMASATLPVWPIALAVGVGCAALGGLVGKGRMQKEYAAAQQYVMENGPYVPGQGRAPEQSKALAPTHQTTVTHEEAKTLRDRIAANEQDAAARVTRQVLATQPLAR